MKMIQDFGRKIPPKNFVSCPKVFVQGYHCSYFADRRKRLSGKDIKNGARMTLRMAKI